jgi:hypothetical protein
MLLSVLHLFILLQRNSPVVAQLDQSRRTQHKSRPRDRSRSVYEQQRYERYGSVKAGVKRSTSTWGVELRQWNTCSLYSTWCLRWVSNCEGLLSLKYRFWVRQCLSRQAFCWYVKVSVLGIDCWTTRFYIHKSDECWLRSDGLFGRFYIRKS